MKLLAVVLTELINFGTAYMGFAGVFVNGTIGALYANATFTN